MTDELWPTRKPGDPTRWVELLKTDEPEEASEVCPVHEYLLSDGYCDVCAASDVPEKSVR